MLAFLSDPAVLSKILNHLGLPTTAPALAPAWSFPAGGTVGRGHWGLVPTAKSNLTPTVKACASDTSGCATIGRQTKAMSEALRRPACHRCRVVSVGSESFPPWFEIGTTARDSISELSVSDGPWSHPQVRLCYRVVAWNGAKAARGRCDV